MDTLIMRPNSIGSTDPPTSAPLPFEDVASSLGEPFATYAAALLRADDAAKQLQAAQATGNLTAIAKATLQREHAIGDVYKLKHDIGSQLLFAMRCARDVFPGVFQEHLDPVFRRELDVTQTALVELENRVNALEDAVVHLESEGATA